MDLENVLGKPTPAKRTVFELILGLLVGANLIIAYALWDWWSIFFIFFALFFGANIAYCVAWHFRFGR